MSERVTMPALGESVTEGTVTRWLKSVGDAVQVDEPLLEVSTDKVDTEIPSPVAGTLQEILVQEDETVPVGADLAVIGDGAAPQASGADAPTEQQEQQGGAEAAAAPEAPSTEAPVQAQTSEPEAGGGQQQEQPAAAPQQSGGGGGGVTGGEKVTMPALGESVTEGTVTRWLKKEGDEVAVDEPLLEVSTDKVDTEIPSPVAGTLTKILVQEDETVPVGADLAIVGGEAAAQEAPQQAAPQQQAPQQAPQQQASSEAAPAQQEADAAQDQAQQSAPAAPAPEPAPQSAAQQPAAEAPAQVQPQGQDSSQEGDGDPSAYVTPLVRKLAADNGVDLSALKGTGVGGRIRKQDVLDAAAAAKKAAEPAPAPAAPAAAPAPAAQAGAPASAEVSAKRGTREKMTRLRKIIAQRMVESLQTSAQLTAVVEVDMTRVAAVRAKAKSDFEKREGVKLSYLPFICVATVDTLKQHPSLNAGIEGEEIVYHGSENLAVAVDTEKGLVVPVIKEAGDLNIAGMARKIADVADRTRTNKIGPDELSGGTFTISNIGSNGSLLDTPIINQPQVAILGTGAITKRPVVVKDEFGNESIAIRSMMYLCLTYDHRVVDGADAGRFLTALKARLEEGAFEA
ncbi:MAG: 2-oxoglutarate dehydrogenase, E2 component, dihydrolipoamide succinyltransferase [Austwickia sp.]|jgi:pyruvate dehydrogenase E2 component (dihydrolipoamide acetyltransferase)|nr:MAG: 2-oxoglutarate dehydrogenase, E2 component, dihydrolipoamide succinyltransferase [Austwickia sp.]